ncbi:MAG: manganese efflux pump MntP family protein, partial [Candidatus Jordarchaeaceae archaeon]
MLSRCLKNHILIRPLSLPLFIMSLAVKLYALWPFEGLDWLFVGSRMDVFSILLIAVGLAMDCFAISITSGVTLNKIRIRDAAKIGMFFGGFQAVMPVLGWMVGSSLAGLVSGFDHWLALGILCFIGGRMIYESIKKAEEEGKFDPLSLHVLLLFSIATSIDALAVGVSFAFLGTAILSPIIIIGIVTFLLSFLGVFAGDRFGQIFKNKAKIVGGLILI